MNYRGAYITSADEENIKEVALMQLPVGVIHYELNIKLGTPEEGVSRFDIRWAR